MSNRSLSRACAGAGQRALGSQRFLARAGLPEEFLTQVVSDELTVNASTTVVDPLFSTLLSVPMTTQGGDLLIWFSESGGSSGVVTPEFRVLLDGVLLAGASALLGIGANSASFALLQKDVAAGAHTITVEWSKIVGSGPTIVLTISPLLLPNQHHASLIVGEVGS